MKVSEEDYIILTNKTKADIANRIVKDILPEFDGVVTKEDHIQVIKILDKWVDGLYAKINRE